MSLQATPGQTVGPFFGYALPFDGSADLVPADHPDVVRLHGTVRDGDGQPVPDALLEIWQDGAGWGRAATDADGQYSFTTTRPDSFVAVCVFARGLLDRLFTRVYPPGTSDAFLDTVPLERRHTLVAVEDDGLRFDVRLQGEDETVFLDFPGR